MKAPSIQGLPIGVAFVLWCGLSHVLNAWLIAGAKLGEIMLSLTKRDVVCTTSLVGSFFHLWVVFPTADVTNIETLRDCFVAAAGAGDEFHLCRSLRLDEFEAGEEVADFEGGGFRGV
jgi:hypothetical protein